MGHYRSEMCCDACGGTKSEWHNCKERWQAIAKALKEYRSKK